jgi:predicted DNA-binding transcriptional regulator AlpA
MSATSHHSLDSLAVLDAQTLASRLGVCRTLIYQMMERQELPPRVQLSQRRFGWRAQDIERWLESRLEPIA